MRKALMVLSICASAGTGGCTFFPDFANSPVYHAPISEVVNQIRCDMHIFLEKQRTVVNPNFSLDDKGYATVELALSTTAFGDVKFAKIDTVRLGAQGFLAVGSSTQPFPSLAAKQLNQTVARVTVNVSQDPGMLRDACGYGQHEVLSSKPTADRVLVNDLRIAQWLTRSFANAQRIKHEGPVCDMRAGKNAPGNACSVSLETAVLTTKFQLIGDASAGVLGLAKLIPVVATPTLQLNVDYYHQITIIFSGNNAVANAGLPMVRGLGPTARSVRQPEPSAADVIRQLRSIRDATILNGTR